MKQKLNAYFNTYTQAAPLAVFRIFFGLMMLLSIVRFWSKGWIESLYIEPQFHFSYFGFEWVKPLGEWTYLLFAICGLAALGMALGYRYRVSAVLFFLSFTYIELMDKTTYLNHYYFISLVSFLLIFLPANVYYSLDAKRKGGCTHIPRWTIDSIKLMLGIVYFYAGLAKLNSDWLLKAQPLKIWLSTQYELPVIGPFLREEWVHYALSWSGAVYDLAIPFLLLYRKTRPYAFVAVVFFHVLTRIFFPIGMFPYIMIVSALIFFDANLHQRILNIISKILGVKDQLSQKVKFWSPRPKTKQYVIMLFAIFFGIQLLLPWRYLAYPGELFWTEQGYRFSWRVMLMEKTGYAEFRVVDLNSGQKFLVDNSEFLTPFQEKEMAAQPDFILEYAQFLGEHFGSANKDIAVYVDSYVTLNGRRSTRFINPNTNLLKEKESFRHKSWILPFTDEIKGL